MRLHPQKADFRASQLPSRATIDRLLALALLIILVLGSMTVYSASSMHSLNLGGGHMEFFMSHVKKILLGLTACLLMLKVDYHFFQKIATPVTVFFLLLLCLTLTQPEVNDSKRWLHFAGVTIQPVDFLKYALMIHLASALSKVRDFRKDYNHLVPSLSMIVLALAVLMVQPNYSMFLVLAAVSGLLIFLAGFPLRWGAWLATGALALASFLLMQGGYRVHRVMSWLATFMDPLKADFQMLHSYIAIGRGGLLGKGAGESIQKLVLPEPFNDFVFSIFCEEYGLVGSLFLVALYAFIFIRGAKIVRRAPDEFGRLLAAGILGLLSCHTLINLMVTTGLIPATGQPLPLFSYGGTAMLTMLGALGILLNISYQSRSLNPGGHL